MHISLSDLLGHFFQSLLVTGRCACILVTHGWQLLLVLPPVLPAVERGCRENASTAGLERKCANFVFYHQTQLINLARGQRGYFNFSRTFGQVIAATTGDSVISLAGVWKKLKASQQKVSGAQCGGIQPDIQTGISPRAGRRCRCPRGSDGDLVSLSEERDADVPGEVTDETSHAGTSQRGPTTVGRSWDAGSQSQNT